MQEFSTFNGYGVKDATAREQLESLAKKYNAHEESENNPHGVTREQIGAAPAGFGLGENAKPMTSADTINANGYYRTNITVNGNAEECVVLHNQESSEYAEQEAISIGNSAGTKLRRTKLGGTWNPWEFVNPPMVYGVEYRTTERYKGKPVYVKAIEMGNLPVSAEKTVAHGIENIDQIVSCAGCCTNVAMSFPYYSYSGTTLHNTANVYATRSAVMLAVTVGTWDKYLGYATIKYTKTTD